MTHRHVQPQAHMHQVILRIDDIAVLRLLVMRKMRQGLDPRNLVAAFRTILKLYQRRGPQVLKVSAPQGTREGGCLG